MASNISNRLSTDTTFFGSLIEDIKQGRIKVPKFQRPYVWEDVQALKLLDSIANSYPVGSLLLWRTASKLKTERQFGEFVLPTTDDMSPTDYVLDGQQRMTVIYSCFGAAPNDPGFSAVFDLQTEEFASIKDIAPALNVFPLRKLFDTTQLLDFRTALQAHVNKDLMQTRLDQLIKSVTTYKIPVVVLKDLSVEEVCPIFERINSSGTKLSTYDLMVAATWSDNFDLDLRVEEIASALSPKGFDDIDKTTVLKCMSAVQLGTIKESALKSLRDLDEPTLKVLTESTKASLLRTIDLLATEFGIYSWDFLSYEALVVSVCNLLSKTNALKVEEIKRIKIWFWRASFSERYKVGGESFVSNDLARIVDYVLGKSGKADDFGKVPNAKDWLTVGFRSNAARSRAYILALSLRAPKNLLNGVTIDVEEALSAFNKKQYHHIYPRAHLKRIEAEIDDNLLLNICLLTAAANLKISDGDPVVYLPKIAQDFGATADEVFSTNLLPKPSAFDYSKASYADFIKARADLVTEFCGKLCEGGI